MLFGLKIYRCLLNILHYFDFQVDFRVYFHVGDQWMNSSAILYREHVFWFLAYLQTDTNGLTDMLTVKTRRFTAQSTRSIPLIEEHALHLDAEFGHSIVLMA